MIALRPVPKAPGSFDRGVSTEQTLALVPALRARFGITRIADITHLDRIGIPVISTIVPNTPDGISVYNGKGATRENAVAGAVMEAVERQVGAAPEIASTILDAAAALPLIDPDYRDELVPGTQVEVVAGRDLLTGDPVVVPLAAVQCPWPGPPGLRAATTDGLASGNSFAEAVYHALAELIERHVWAVAHAQAHLRPKALISQFAGTAISIPGFVDDPVASDVRFPTGSTVIDGLAERILAAGLTLRLRAVDLDPFPVLMIATIADPAGGLSASHGGRGCSLSPVHAAIRAITEAAQSRAADFSGAREDLFPYFDPNVPSTGIRRKAGLPTGRWYYDAPAEQRALTSFPDRSTDDVAEDVGLLAAALRDAGAGRVSIVDLSPPETPCYVVRAVAPSLETAPNARHLGPTIRSILDLDVQPAIPIRTR